MKSPIQALMEESHAPMTRDEYVRWNNLGKSAKVTPEEEVELPKRFQYPIVTHEDLPGTKAGKAGKAGKTLPNPKNLKPQLDTETPAKPLILPGSPKMNITNPPKTNLEVAEPREQ